MDWGKNSWSWQREFNRLRRYERSMLEYKQLAQANNQYNEKFICKYEEVQEKIKKMYTVIKTEAYYKGYFDDFEDILISIVMLKVLADPIDLAW
jgi:hypothetical protein